MMRLLLVAAALCAASCATAAAEREPFSLDALFADPPGYVSAHYQRNELPSALIADLTAANFECQNSAQASTCGRSRRSGNCFYMDTVRIYADKPVEAARNQPRCMGVLPPRPRQNQ